MEAADRQRKLGQLRACYIRLKANDRNYRDALLAYAYTLKAGGGGQAESAEVARARRAQRDARAEAQMTVSEEVLEAEGKVNNRFAVRQFPGVRFACRKDTTRHASSAPD